MKKAWLNFLTSLKPTYSVEVTTYHVVPGFPLNKNQHRHDFAKGAFEEAKSFFDEVVKKTGEIRLAPVEVHLVKGKKKVVQRHTFGPVEEVKKLK